jgi:hypothetical protein
VSQSATPWPVLAENVLDAADMLVLCYVPERQKTARGTCCLRAELTGLTLQRAKELLGITRTEKDGRYYWRINPEWESRLQQVGVFPPTMGVIDEGLWQKCYSRWQDEDTRRERGEPQRKTARTPVRGANGAHVRHQSVSRSSCSPVKHADPSLLQLTNAIDTPPGPSAAELTSHILKSRRGTGIGVLQALDQPRTLSAQESAQLERNPEPAAPEQLSATALTVQILQSYRQGYPALSAGRELGVAATIPQADPPKRSEIPRRFPFGRATG